MRFSLAAPLGESTGDPIVSFQLTDAAYTTLTTGIPQSVTPDTVGCTNTRIVLGRPTTITGQTAAAAELPEPAGT